jgi:hypothetical protein
MGINGSNFGQNLNHQTSWIYKNADGWTGGHKHGWVAQLVLYK